MFRRIARGDPSSFHLHRDLHFDFTLCRVVVIHCQLNVFHAVFGFAPPCAAVRNVKRIVLSKWQSGHQRICVVKGAQIGHLMKEQHHKQETID